MKEMSDLFCGKAAVGGNYNSTRDTFCKQSKQEKIKRQKMENIVNALCKQAQIFRKKV